MRWKLFVVGVLIGSLAFQSLPTTADQLDALPVTFSTQFDGSQFAQTNCGPASVAMAINFATGQKLTPLQVRQTIARQPGGGYAANPTSGTAIHDLARIARDNKVEVFLGDGASSIGWGPERIRKHLDLGHPVILLTRLAQLPGYSPTSQFDHYILVIGATATGFIYHDPGQGAGAKRTISAAQLQLAQKSSGIPGGQGVAFAGPTSGRPTGAGSGATSAASPTADSDTVKYTVAKGDTLSQLAARHGISAQQIATLNRGVVRNVNHIEVGQVLSLPVLPAPPAPPAPPTPTPVATIQVTTKPTQTTPPTPAPSPTIQVTTKPAEKTPAKPTPATQQQPRGD